MLGPNEPAAFTIAIPDDARAGQRVERHRRLSHAAGQPDRGAGAPDPGALRLLRADLVHDLPAGHGAAVLPVAPGRGPQADRAQPRDAREGLRAADRLRVQAEGLRVVRRGPGPRGADRLRPAGVHRTWPRCTTWTRRCSSARAQWLLGARDGKGGFKRERRALHTWIADPGLLQRLHHLGAAGGGRAGGLADARRSRRSRRPRRRARTATSSRSAPTWPGSAGDKDAAKTLARQAGRRSRPRTGYVDGGDDHHRRQRRRGAADRDHRAGDAGLAARPGLRGAVEKGIKWLADVCKAGRYGSTQSTVLALRAILAYDAARAKPKAPGHGAAHRGRPPGRQRGRLRRRDTQGAIKLTDIAELLEPGEHTVELAMTGGSEMPCSLAVQLLQREAGLERAVQGGHHA